MSLNINYIKWLPVLIYTKPTKEREAYQNNKKGRGLQTLSRIVNIKSYAYLKI